MAIKVQVYSALLFISAAGAATALATDKTPSKFYDMEEQYIPGHVRAPSGLYLGAREKAKFDKLLVLKKNFRAKIVDSQSDGALR